MTISNGLSLAGDTPLFLWHLLLRELRPGLAIVPGHPIKRAGNLVLILLLEILGLLLRDPRPPRGLVRLPVMLHPARLLDFPVRPLVVDHDVLGRGLGRGQGGPRRRGRGGPGVVLISQVLGLPGGDPRPPVLGVGLPLILVVRGHRNLLRHCLTRRRLVPLHQFHHLGRRHLGLRRRRPEHRGVDPGLPRGRGGEPLVPGV
mmetsp:Transcript_34770/g.84065  ORF Transcript_34770/g.84065 Transcript_34770/m.84065 type:complete len:202 (-) Transcript_34770:411-1016(-)